MLMCRSLPAAILAISVFAVSAPRVSAADATVTIQGGTTTGTRVVMTVTVDGGTAPLQNALKSISIGGTDVTGGATVSVTNGGKTVTISVNGNFPPGTTSTVDVGINIQRQNNPSTATKRVTFTQQQQ